MENVRNHKHIKLILENVRNHRHIKLITNKLFMLGTKLSYSNFFKHLLSIEMKKVQIFMNKSVYLEISKTVMYEF